MGKKSPKREEASAHEKALSEISLAKWDRYKNKYQGVEKEFIDKIGQDASGLLRGRALADVAQATGDSAAGAVQLGRGSATQLGATASNMAGARTKAATTANKSAEQVRQKGQLSALAIGHDMSADAQSGLANAARAANQEALAKARAQAEINSAKMAALGEVAGAGVSAYEEKKYLDRLGGEVSKQNYRNTRRQYGFKSGDDVFA